MGATTSRFMSISEVLPSVGVSRATLYRMIAAGQFPAPVKVGSASRWQEHEIDEWKVNLAERRNAA